MNRLVHAGVAAFALMGVPGVFVAQASPRQFIELAPGWRFNQDDKTVGAEAPSFADWAEADHKTGSLPGKMIAKRDLLIFHLPGLLGR